MTPPDGKSAMNGAVPGAPTHVVHRVAITGGPCAGKTTGLAEVAERLRSRGFGVFVVPEAATLLFTGGASLQDFADDHIVNLQTQLLRTQVALEDRFVQLAATATARETFVLCDRGTCDGRAYMSASLWKRMLHANDWHMVDIRDARYDLVVHLVTAANGAEEYYSLDSNKTRTETPAEAIAVDERTQAAWVGHPHLRIVDNRTGFRDKINRVDSLISQLAGLHLLPRIVHKFLLSPQAPLPSHQNTNTDDHKDAVLAALSNLSIDVEHFFVEQTFLNSVLGADVQESVRKRGTNAAFTYVHKVRRSAQAETKRQLGSVFEYRSLLKNADRDRGTVRISRYCFLYDGRYFVLDCVTNVQPPIRLLRCQADRDNDEVKIPPAISVDAEVTGDKKYMMHSIAKRVLEQEKKQGAEGGQSI